ncbi:MAG: 1-deoxy-D-xylulose-5-phosphate synthase, partial [Treponema sp.]|nr:1-deoxy-D-xylulose-5-phosphate synthase [Treponema sp.]
MRTERLLPGINSPEDLKNLNANELNLLAAEIREKIVSTVSDNGGHLASNLGVVELSIALHRVFNSPEDKIVWDVGHQCYTHKLLTGRFKEFSSLRMSGGIAGFPKREESQHDAFNTGHASTSISAALGLLAAEKLLGGKGRAAAIIGDGALTGGLAYEALSHAGHLGLPLIVILNDNKMSISPNVGGLSKYLSRLSMKKNYQIFRRNFDAAVRKIPFIGEAVFNMILRLKRAVKAVFYTDNFFVDLGFEYVGPIGGHDIQDLIDVFQDVIQRQDAQQLNRPVVIHVITRKGKGYGYAEDDPDSYHGVSAFSVDGGLAEDFSERGKTFTEAFASAIYAAAARDKKVAALTAAMQKGTGLSAFRQAFPDRFFDVGIAEEHMVTFAAGLAARGLKPVAAVYSTFIQRAVDQVTHDAALQKLPVILALDRAGFVPNDGETHQGLFDIALFRSTPNTAILSPASENELRLMLNWALELETGPMIIRYPKACCPKEIPAFSLPVEQGRGVWLLKNNRQICLAFAGGLYKQVLDAAVILEEQGIEADLYNLRFLKPVDEEYLANLMNSYEYIGFIEEGIREGGFG